MILDLVSHTDPILRETMPKFDFQGSISAKDLADNLLETMIAKRGIGLSANQVGIRASVFVMNRLFRFGPLVVFNPKIIELGTKTESYDEGCLSFPGVYVKVPRPTVVQARFAGIDGKMVTQTFEDMEARTFLHEYDHLQGKVITNLVTKFVVERAIKRAQKRGKSYSLKELVS
jgi:peptide deformylase